MHSCGGYRQGANVQYQKLMWNIRSTTSKVMTVKFKSIRFVHTQLAISKVLGLSRANDMLEGQKIW